jgi:hypothetical protein
MPSPPFRIQDGTVRIYRLFDVADAIDLARAEALAAEPKSRFRLEGPRTRSAVEIPQPPLHLRLGARDAPFDAGPRRVEVRVHLFDYGVASLLLELPIPPGTSLEDLLPLSEELLDRPTPGLDAIARRGAEELVQALRPSMERARSWEGLETYTVFFVRSFDRPVSPRELLADAPLARLLLGERDPTPLSVSERADVLKHHFSYLESDLAVVDWNSAFVLEPSGSTDVPDLLEFATAHLLELRYYDALLDRELRRIYDEVEATGARGLLTRRYGRLLRQTAALLLELSEMVERLENAVKFVGDFYLARLYQAAVRRFRLPAWQETVLRKQRLLADVNRMLSDAADTRRGELLEITIIALIAWEILYALLRR